MRVLILGLIMAFGIVANAAIEPIQATFKKQNKYVDSGVFLGGEAQRDLILKDVRRSFSAKQKVERIVFEVAPTKGKAERVGYFNVAAEKKLHRVTIDIAGVAASKESLEEITKKLKKSPLIQDATITMDPEDRSATVLLSLNKRAENARVEAFEMKGNGESGRLVVDIVASQGK